MKRCKVIVGDECYGLVNVLTNNYPWIYFFICGLHKLKNI